MPGTRRKKSGRTRKSPSKSPVKTPYSYENDPVSSEVSEPVPPPRARLVNILTTYKVDEKEVYNTKVSVKVLDSLTPQEIRDLRFVFEAFDSNRDGLMPLIEVRRALIALGFKLSKSEVRNMMADADLGDTKGECNFNTFLEFVIDKQGDSRDNLDELEKSFRLFDIEGSGKLTQQSLRNLCKQYDVKLKDDELSDMVREADKNGDGSINKNEFVDMMLKTNLFA